MTFVGTGSLHRGSGIMRFKSRSLPRRALDAHQLGTPPRAGDRIHAGCSRRLAHMATCPACGRQSPDGFQFCGYCSAPLSAPAATGGVKERKVVSVLFCDLVGFTAASESADPEEVQARIAPYHARTRERIEAFGGTVEKFIGDAVMAVFGAPTAHEDDAERAVRAGLALLEAIEELNAAGGSLALSVRVGVNTGEAVVSLDARPELGEGIVTGDVVNTAARIQ